MVRGPDLVNQSSRIIRSPRFLPVCPSIFVFFPSDFQLVTDTQTSKITFFSADVGTTYFDLFFLSFFSYISVAPNSDLDFTGLCVRYKLKVEEKTRKPTDRQEKKREDRSILDD